MRRPTPMLGEPDVTLTDWALAVQATVLAVWVARGAPPSPALIWWTTFFASVAAAALLGGLVHGVFPDHAPLWRATMLAIGVTTLSAWAAGAHALGWPRVARWIVGIAAAGFCGYAIAVVSGPAKFGLAVAHYAPGAVFLLVALARLAWRTRAKAVTLGVLGIVVLLAGSSVQALQIAVHPVYFTHNAVFHVIEMVALALLYPAAAWLGRRPSHV